MESAEEASMSMQIFHLARFGALAAALVLSLVGTALAQAASTESAPAQAAPAQTAPTEAAPTEAEPKTETFGRWLTIVDETNTDQDVRKTCAASTTFLDANGTRGTLTLAISNGDVLPPNGYPSVVVALKNKDLPTGENIAAVFGDDKGKVKATVSTSAGGQWMLNNKKETALAVLRAMRRAGALDVAFGDIPLASISMDGFTKAYRSLGASCGFPTGDVAP
jgi:invasion protein IalB